MDFSNHAKVLRRQAPHSRVCRPPHNQQQQRHITMMLHDKMRQAGLIVIATAVLLILPNLTSLTS